MCFSACLAYCCLCVCACSPSTSSDNLGTAVDLLSMLTQIITARSALDLGGTGRQRRSSAAAAAAAAGAAPTGAKLPPRADTPGSNDGAALQSAQAGLLLSAQSAAADLAAGLSRGQSGSGPLAEQPACRPRRGQSSLTGRRAAQLLHHAAGAGSGSLGIGGSADSVSSETSGADLQELSSADEAEAALENAAASISSSSKLPPPEMPPIEMVEQVLQSANEWQFDAFALAEATKGHPLSTLAYFLFSKQGLIDHYQLRPTALARFLRRIESGYRTNPYHNATHASDVLQTMHCIITRGGLMPGYVDPMHMMACYTAAVSVC